MSQAPTPHESAGGTPRLAVVVKGYPRISETFIARELLGYEQRGLALLIVSLRAPYDRLRHPVHAAIRAPVLYLPEYLKDAPGRVVRGHRRAFLRAPSRYLRTAGVWLRDLAREPTVNRVRRFGQAGVLAAELPDSIRHLHVHFAHTPASVGRYAALMTGRSWSLATHAKDVWTRPAWEVREKLLEARFTVTCAAATQRHLATVAPGAPLHLVYHGLDRRLFSTPARFGSPRDGSDPADPVRLLAVGRFYEKKGVDVLLEAMALVRPHASLTIVGYGPEEPRLRALAARRGLDARVRWAGQLDQPAVLALYRESDLFVLASRVAADGDRDGLPNVVVEALSQGLPVVATRIAAIPEIIEDGVHGRLVPPDDPGALAAALTSLIIDPGARRRLGQMALQRVTGDWDVETAVDRLVRLLAPHLTPGGADAAESGTRRAAIAASS